MKIKKFDDKKTEKEQDVLFTAKSLEKDKDEKPSFKTSVEDQEKVEKEFKKNKDKIEKFESFITINIDHVDNIDCENDYDLKDDENIKKASEFVNTIFSESLKYHLDNNKPITENIFRPGSEAFFNVIKEARQLLDSGKVQLCDIDKELYESTEIGNFGYFNGELVPLDLPMESIEELNEAEYKGKEVKLNYPTRSSGPKKYKVYVKNPKTGKVIKVNFGDVKGGLTAKISDPKARKAFSSRMNCPSKKDKTKAGFWACRLNKFGHLFGGRTYPGYW